MIMIIIIIMIILIMKYNLIYNIIEMMKILMIGDDESSNDNQW